MKITRHTVYGFMWIGWLASKENYKLGHDNTDSGFSIGAQEQCPPALW